MSLRPLRRIWHRTATDRRPRSGASILVLLAARAALLTEALPSVCALLAAALLSACAGSDWKHEEIPPRPVSPAAFPVAEDALRVVLETSLGAIVIGLYAEQAPVSAQNFVAYVESGFYDGTIFHRIAKNPAVVQGGGFEPGMQRKETRPAILNEAANGLSNVRGTVAMARTSDPDSATSQFYINVEDNTFLDQTGPTPREYGYAVYGLVLEGMEVVDRMFIAPREMGEQPAEDLVISSARLLRPSL